MRVAITGVSGDVGRGAVIGLTVPAARELLGASPWILGLDSSEDCPAYRLVDTHERMPPVRDEGYVDHLVSVLRGHRIDLLLPGIDPEIAILSRARARLSQSGTAVVLAPEDLVEAADDKLATASFLEARQIAFARTWAAETGAAVSPPLVAKPRQGNASVGVTLLPDETALQTFRRRAPSGYCLQELLEGPEITVGLLYDRAGILRDALAMERTLVDGRTARARTVDTPALRRFIDDFGGRVRGIGAVNVQLRDDPRRGPVAFEVNARLSGSTELRVALGFNDPLRIVRHFLTGAPIERASIRSGTIVRRDGQIEVVP
jgi:carbamoyl-phosphate synthase large subunit